MAVVHHGHRTVRRADDRRLDVDAERLVDRRGDIGRRNRAVARIAADLGANTVRLPINTYSVGTAWWNSYTGVVDSATARGLHVAPAAPTDLQWASKRVARGKSLSIVT